MKIQFIIFDMLSKQTYFEEYSDDNITYSNIFYIKGQGLATHGFQVTDHYFIVSLLPEKYHYVPYITGVNTILNTSHIANHGSRIVLINRFSKKIDILETNFTAFLYHIDAAYEVNDKLVLYGFYSFQESAKELSQFNTESRINYRNFGFYAKITWNIINSTFIVDKYEHVTTVDQTNFQTENNQDIVYLSGRTNLNDISRITKLNLETNNAIHYEENYNTYFRDINIIKEYSILITIKHKDDKDYILILNTDDLTINKEICLQEKLLWTNHSDGVCVST